MNTCLGVCNVMGDLVKLKELPVHYAQEFILNSIAFIKASAKSSSDPRRVAVLCAFCLLLARDTDPTSTKVFSFYFFTTSSLYTCLALEACFPSLALITTYLAVFLAL